MAIYLLQVRTVSRGKGQSAVASAAYRSGERLKDTGRGLTYDYRSRSKKKNEIVGKSLHNWQGTRSQLWNAVEASEKRKNSTVAREILVALPCELTDQQRQILVNEFSAKLAQTFNFAVDACIHRPGGRSRNKEDRDKNHHAHILVSTRKVDSAGNFGEKTREWDELGKDGRGRETIERVRLAWEVAVNNALKQAGHTERVDRRRKDEREKEALAQAKKRAGQALPVPEINWDTEPEQVEQIEPRKHETPKQEVDNPVLKYKRQAERARAAAPSLESPADKLRREMREERPAEPTPKSPTNKKPPPVIRRGHQPDIELPKRKRGLKR